MQTEWHRDPYTISTKKERLDIPLIHDFLSKRSYWAVGRTEDVVRRSIENSLNFGLYKGDQQIGFGRVISDYATFAWIADVFVLDEYRGHGLGKWMMDLMISHPNLQRMRRWVLATKDAHGLYRQYGFVELKRPERFMERHDPQAQESSDYWKEQ